MASVTRSCSAMMSPTEFFPLGFTRLPRPSDRVRSEGRGSRVKPSGKNSVGDIIAEQDLVTEAIDELTVGRRGDRGGHDVRRKTVGGLRQCLGYQTGDG